MKLAAVHFSPTTCYFLRLRYECLPERPTPENLQLISFLNTTKFRTHAKQ